MRYLLYIIGILAIVSLGMILRPSGMKVQVSHPALIINDKIISESELKELSKFGSYHSRGANFLDSVITRELLIQAAIKQGINKEEKFRKSVQNFYEQSLIKILIDRKFQSLSPTVKQDLVDRYRAMSGKALSYTKFVYKNEEAATKDHPSSSEHLVHAFGDLSDELKYVFLVLPPGKLSEAEATDAGYVRYRLDKTTASPAPGAPQDIQEIKAFLVQQEKRAMFDAWLKQLKAAAHIRILTHDITQ
jgi:hypothetical protein